MNRSVRTSAILAIVAAGAGMAFADQVQGPPGKDLFLAGKCNTCHSVTAAGIEKKKAASTEEKAEKTKKKPPDLSSVGLEKKADWIAKFLTKKETLEGEKHPKLYKGTEAELKTLSAWLEAQKAPKKKASK
jgi:mono/diheme cytochrome c family protein